MEITKIIEAVSVPGAWGVALSFTILVLGIMFSIFIIRRINNGINRKEIDWSRAGIILLSTLLFLCSGAWSGWALFLTYQEANPILAWVLAGGLVIVGGVTSVVLQSYATRALLENGASRTMVVFNIMLIAGFWLLISPVFNAMTICRHAAVQAEISERYQSLNRASHPIVEQYNIFRSKVVPLLVDIQQFIEKSIREQEEIGGCGPICNKYKDVFQALEPSIVRLFEEYSPDDDDSNFAVSIMEIQQEIFQLLAGNEWSSEEMRTIFFRLASNWNQIIFKAKNSDDPKRTLQRAMVHLDGLSFFLTEYAEKDIEHGSIRYRAVKAAMASLQPKLDDLKILLQSRKITFVTSPESSILIQNNSDNLSEISTIRITPLLLWKHIHLYWNSVVLALFIDFLAISMVVLPMTATMLRSRPVQRAMEAVRRSKVQVSRALSALDALGPLSKDLEEKEQRLLGQYEQRISSLNKQKDIAIVRESKKIDTLIDSRLKERRRAVAQRTQLLESIQKDMETKLQKVTSSDEENEIRGRHAIYAKNINNKFTDSLEHISQEETALKKNRDKILIRIDEKFNLKQKNIEERYTHDSNNLLKRKETALEQKARLEAKINKKNSTLQMAEEELAMLQNNGSGNINYPSLNRRMI